MKVDKHDSLVYVLDMQEIVDLQRIKVCVFFLMRVLFCYVCTILLPVYIPPPP